MKTKFLFLLLVVFCVFFITLAAAEVRVNNFLELEQAFQTLQDDTIIIESDIVFDKTLKISNGKSFIIKDNGSPKKFRFPDKSTDYPMLKIEEGASLVLSASDNKNENLVFTGYDSANKPIKRASNVYQQGLFINSSGNLTIEAASFRDYDKDKNSQAVAPIYVKGNKANLLVNNILVENIIMHQETIWFAAGAIFATENANVVFNNGIIRNNDVSTFDYPSFIDNVWSSLNSAGAIIIADGSHLEFNGGEIYNNRSYIGGISVGEPDLFTINRNTSDPSKIYSKMDKFPFATAVLNGGKIYNNKAPGASGALFVSARGTIEIPENSNIDIYGNKAYQGGAVLVEDYYTEGGSQGRPRTYAGVSIEEWDKILKSSFIMRGGSIHDNYAFAHGGGVCAAANGAEFYGGKIYNNRANDQGGGIYVASLPYTIKVYNAYIHNNNARVLSGPSASGVSEPIGLDENGKPIMNNFALHKGTGGGIWFCPTGDAEFYVENGATIADNTASKGGDDFFTEKKAYDITRKQHSLLIKLPYRSLGGGVYKWYEDNYNARHSDSNKKSFEVLNNYIIDVPLEGIGLKTEVSSIAKDIAKEQASLEIYNNSANKGGGIGSNGNAVFGSKPNKDKPIAELKIEKIWADGLEKSDIDVDIVVIINGKKRVLESLNLNQANSYKATVADLPVTIEGKNIEDIISIEEKNAEKYIVSTGKINVAQNTEIEKRVENRIIKFTIKPLSLSFKNDPKPSDTPTPSPTPTVNITPTPDISPTPSASITETPKISPSPSITPSASITPSPTLPSIVPQTGDRENVFAYIILSLISLVFVSLIILRKKYNK